MKKTIGLIILMLISYSLIINVFQKQDLIPDEAIRLRILANSDSQADQLLKQEVRDKVQKELFLTLKDVKGIDEARNIIKTNIPKVESVVADVLKNEKVAYSFDVDYGNHYFPAKEFKGVVYDAGEYESLLITLGSGSGSNWWCVMFPPLCLLEASESTDVEYHIFIKDLINKYL